MQNDIDIITFENDILQYNAIEEQIKTIKKKLEPLQKVLKELKQEKVIVQKEICEIMNKHGISACNLPKDEKGNVPGTIKYSSTTAISPLTRDMMKDLLIDFFNKDTRTFDCLKPTEKGLYIFNYITSRENRPKFNKETVRKVKYTKEDIDITQNYIIDDNSFID